MSAMPGMPPMGAGGPPPPPDQEMGPGEPAGAPGAPQFPSADPQAIMALLSQLIAGDQQALGQAQVKAVAGAFSQILASQPDPAAQAAATGAPPVVGPSTDRGPASSTAY